MGNTWKRMLLTISGLGFMATGRTSLAQGGAMEDFTFEEINNMRYEASPPPLTGVDFQGDIENLDYGPAVLLRAKG